jgi:hypothetical protein
MATKEFIGPVDCLGAALPDEEYFMLLARDPLAAGLTMIWASLRLGDLASAATNFQRLCTQPGLIPHYREHPDQAKAEEAVDVAQRMVDWRERNLTAGEGGKPSWKSSRAAGVERFIVEFVERRPESAGGAVIVRACRSEIPYWAQGLYKPVSFEHYASEPPIAIEHQPPAETEGDMS